MIPHGSPSPSPPHGGSIATGSGTVMINSKPACRIGDAISCGQAVAQGSGNVICG
ncbi:PAAR domain-containing protein [Campylobacter coli]